MATVITDWFENPIERVDKLKIRVVYQDTEEFERLMKTKIIDEEWERAQFVVVSTEHPLWRVFVASYKLKQLVKRINGNALYLLAKSGHMTTPPGCYLRWRDISIKRVDRSHDR